jgi:hypothetical protein
MRSDSEVYNDGISAAAEEPEKISEIFLKFLGYGRLIVCP